MPVDYCRHLVGKTLRNVCHCDSAKMRFVGKSVITRTFFLTLADSILFQLTRYLTHTHTHTRLTALCPGLPRWAGTRKVTPIWIFVKQETVSGSGISWAVCKSAPRSRQTTTPAPHHSVFYRPDALSAAPNQQRRSTEGLRIIDTVV